MQADLSVRFDSRHSVRILIAWGQAVAKSQFSALVLATFAGLVLAPAQASAQVPGARAFNVACENGRAYVLRPRAQTVSGDVITGYLMTSRRGSTHVRLMPLGEGYRYAGRGIWLDGIRSEALLYLSKRHPVPCAVTPIV